MATPKTIIPTGTSFPRDQHHRTPAKTSTDPRILLKIRDNLSVQDHLVGGVNVYLFEIRTNFILKRTSVDEDEIVLCSESFDAYSEECECEDEWYLEQQTSYRLKEYWMPEDEIDKLVHEAFNFAKHHKSIRSTVIPFIVDVDVCTVQQDGEELEAAMDRAIRAENLVPLYLWHHIKVEDDVDKLEDILDFLQFNLPRMRVEDVDQGLGLMETCPVCLHDPTVGAQISLLPQCSHQLLIFYSMETFRLKIKKTKLIAVEVCSDH
ncbi:hypothetical protein DH2020_029952 [Rehmannia glutinosa]|uniref:Uncharacterized protein n=1 Tax=Rehmannia glutinosa TaxID=99300 RepID=A0ABR0VM73_REHGL